MPAIRLAAHLIKTKLGRERVQVLALECGHAVAAQSLSAFLTRAVIHSASTVFPQGDEIDLDEGQADAVVLNLPSFACFGYVYDVLHREDPLTGRAIDKWLRHPRTDPGKHGSILLETAMEYLAPHGLLIVLGDVESGIHHQAEAALSKNDHLHRYQLTADNKPVQFTYAKQPWGIYGSLPPTGRLLSAWRRLP